MAEKGYWVLDEFVKEFGGEAICYVVSAKDKNVENDYFDEIRGICLAHSVDFYDRFSIPEIAIGNRLKFAIGWRWLISGNADLIVLHDSLLPKYRGFSPVVSALINGDNVIGVTALKAEAEYDRGDILLQKSLYIEYPIKISDVIHRLSRLYSSIVKEIYFNYINGRQQNLIKQNESDATYSLWRDENDYLINWNQEAARIMRTIDALGYPYLGARAYMNKEIVVIKSSQILDDIRIENRFEAIGKVFSIKDGLPVVVCKEGVLQLTDIVNAKSNLSILPIKKLRIRFE
jgi:methionyl-tRNA formyltransferase